MLVPAFGASGVDLSHQLEVLRADGDVGFVECCEKTSHDVERDLLAAVVLFCWHVGRYA